MFNDNSFFNLLNLKLKYKLTETFLLIDIYKLCDIQLYNVLVWKPAGVVLQFFDSNTINSPLPPKLKSGHQYHINWDFESSTAS